MGSEGQSPRIPPAAKALSFGPFEADPRTRKLRKHGVRIRLGEQPFQILAALIERPGELVTREELRELLWPGNTFVEFDDSLNSAVKKLRDALGDAARDPRYIETVPTRGYLFIATVETVQSNAAARIGATPGEIGTIERQRRLRGNRQSGLGGNRQIRTAGSRYGQSLPKSSDLGGRGADRCGRYPLASRVEHPALEVFGRGRPTTVSSSNHPGGARMGPRQRTRFHVGFRLKRADGEVGGV